MAEETKPDEKNETPETPTETPDINSPIIEAAKTENDRREKILKEEKELQSRKEKLHAEEMAGGRARMGEAPKEEKETPEQLAERFDKGEVDILT